ncbi:hypothetical protein BO443_20722 [Burkholderia orbicola]
MFARGPGMRYIAVIERTRKHRRATLRKLKAILVATLLGTLFTPTAWAGLFGPSNWEECVLDRMPGVQNDYAAAVIITRCSDEFGNPDTVRIPEKGWLTRFNSGDACVAAKASTTASVNGARVIVASCHRLFDPPPPLPQRSAEGLIDPFLPPPNR